MARDKTTGKFIADPADAWRKPHGLVWERIAEPEPQPVVEVRPIAVATPAPKAVDAKGNPVAMDAGRSRAPNGAHKTTCKCGKPLDREGRYCKACHAAAQAAYRKRQRYWMGDLTAQDVA